VFRSKELGLRVVLSGIVTPQNRGPKLRQDWRKISAQSRLFRASSGPSEPTSEFHQSENVVAQIEHLAAAATDQAEKQKLLAISEYFKQFNRIFAEKEFLAIDALIWEALFVSESLVKYSSRRRLLQQDLEMLKNLKTQTIPETEIESLNQNISTLNDKLRSIDAVIDYLVQSYITDIQESQKFSDDAIERQLNRIILDRNLEKNLRASLNGRLNLFKDHISYFKKEPQSVQKKNILKDILSAY
jgi:hypothetical protein